MSQETSTSNDRIALGIGPQSDISSINTSVRDSVKTVNDVASGSGGSAAATSILVDRSDVDFSFSRVESDPRPYENEFNTLAGSFYRVDPTLSFTVPFRASGNMAAAAAGRYSYDEGWTQMLAGAGFVRPSALTTTTSTGYQLHQRDVTYQTLKLWRGERGVANKDEAWVFDGCFFNLTFSFSIASRPTMTVDVFANNVTNYAPSGEYSASGSSWPPTFPAYQEFHEDDITNALGGRLPYPQMGGDATCKIGAQTNRGMTDFSISIENETTTSPDSNATKGIVTSPSGRNVSVSMTSLVETSDVSSTGGAGFDHKQLLNTTGGSTLPQVDFSLGGTSAVGTICDGFIFKVGRFQPTEVSATEYGAERVINTINGYAARGSGTEAQPGSPITLTLD